MAKRKNRKVTAEKNPNTRKHLKANRKYKDTVFRMLFSDRKNLLSLYNAVNGTSYDDPSKLEIVTLENAVYIGMKNDLSFIVNMNLFLYEHQSTYNPNMPLRDLLYIAAEYQKLVDNKSLYSPVLQKIPAPNFVVFYNGTAKKEDNWVTYLSEAYENLSGEPNLELKVLTLNVNDGHNRKLMEECHTLREYAQYVAKVRKYTKEMKLDEAVEQAVDECIREGILVEFLRKNKSEVVAMSIFEYNKEEEERKWKESVYEFAKAEVLEAGREEGRKEGREEGRKEGRAEGLALKLQAEKEIAQSLAARGMALSDIAEITKVSLETIRKWLEKK
ncbi:hypothetical protein [Blautia obeum]|uniref:Transposase, YhgA-like n=1 Tax=Blautia obeum TaxID=40520 RepID=A0A367G1C8_9FIRM|nr:hypothetical protein [Blautia obeum]RCH43709.1 hypothetical protein C4886_09880 [Blautia obeum]